MRLVFKNNYSSWDLIPHVILSEMIKATEWFKELSGTIKFFDTKTEWANDHSDYPKRFNVNLKYKSKGIVLQVGYDYARAGHVRATMQLTSPYDYSELYRTESGDAKNFGCKDIEGILPRMAKAVEWAKPVLDTEIKELNKANTAEQSKQILTNAVADKIGVADLKHTSYGHDFNYNEGENYNLSFSPVKKAATALKNGAVPDEKGLFEISSIDGEFTYEDLQKIIEVVGGNVRAVTERMLKGTNKYM